jgi:hypothetical protein
MNKKIEKKKRSVRIFKVDWWWGNLITIVFDR